MPITQKYDLVDTEIPKANIADLISQYDLTRLKLHQCAMYEAGDNLTRNTEMADNEYLYMSKQEEILSAAAAAPLKTEGDVKNLLRLWQKEKDEGRDDMSSADGLVMAICHHYDVVA